MHFYIKKCGFAAFNERSFGGMLENSFEHSEIGMCQQAEKLGLPQIFNLWEEEEWRSS